MIELKRLIRKMAFLLSTKKVVESKINARRISVKKEDTTWFNLSTNSVVMLNCKEKNYFFRECPEICSSYKYIKKRIERFFRYINNNDVKKMNFRQVVPIRINFSQKEIDGFKEYVYSRIDNKKFIKSILKLYKTLDAVSFSIFGEKNTLEFDEFVFLGLDNLTESFFDIATYFLWCMRTVSLTLINRSLIRGKKYSHINAVKAVSTSIISESLGLDSLVTKAEWCELDIDGDIFFGVVSPVAEGIRAVDIEQIEPNIKLQRELLCLNILDVICYQPDHGPNNYNISFYGEKPIGVCAFDNDNPNTLFPIMSISKRLSACDSLLNSKKEINRPYLDVDVADRIFNVDKKLLCKRLKNYLNYLQRKALIIRLTKLKKAIKKTSIKNKEFLLETDFCNEKLQDEILGKFGQTYLTVLLKSIQR